MAVFGACVPGAFGVFFVVQGAAARGVTALTTGQRHLAWAGRGRRAAHLSLYWAMSCLSSGVSAFSGSRAAAVSKWAMPSP